MTWERPWGPPELETDNITGTGDERPITGSLTGHDSLQHTAAMAHIVRYVQNPTPWVEVAKRGMDYARKNNKRGAQLFPEALSWLVVVYLGIVVLRH
jgi:hypothetical protein